MSLGESFHRRSGSSLRERNRFSCSTSDTLNQYGEIVLMDRSWYNRAGVEHVMGYCTNIEYHRFLHQAPIRSVGVGRATTRVTRGLRYCVTRLMVEPLPAASRPSKMSTTTLDT
jgi:hypothetical protein